MSNTTNEFLLDKAKKCNIHLNAVVSKDEFDALDLREGGYIVNLDNSTQDGSHWVSLYVGDAIYYFDSFGIQPPFEILEGTAKLHKKFYCNSRQIQNINSGYCGYYALLFINAMQKNPTHEGFIKFINSFSKDVKKNLTKLKMMFKILPT